MVSGPPAQGKVGADHRVAQGEPAPLGDPRRDVDEVGVVAVGPDDELASTALTTAVAQPTGHSHGLAAGSA